MNGSLLTVTWTVTLVRPFRQCTASSSLVLGDNQQPVCVCVCVSWPRSGLSARFSHAPAARHPLYMYYYADKIMQEGIRTTDSVWRWNPQRRGCSSSHRHAFRILWPAWITAATTTNHAPPLRNTRKRHLPCGHSTLTAHPHQDLATWMSKLIISKSH